MQSEAIAGDIYATPTAVKNFTITSQTPTNGVIWQTIHTKRKS